MTSLLVTKLHIPRPRTNWVSRPRLMACLEQGLSKKLLLLSAPAGYGKTTLLSEWLAASQQPAAWVALDAGDNDPARFWNYICAALQKAYPSALPGAPVAAPGPDFLTGLINALDQAQQPLVLVLDDYHCIEAQPIHADLAYLLEFAPAHFHLVLSTRADPALPLAKLRARSMMFEVRQADLCFTPQEAVDFLNRTMELPLSDDDAARITARTEGWPAGLQMAALSMRGAADISRSIELLSGSHHYIFDYLMEEVLNSQTAEIRRFLLYTSILNQLTAPLCDALLHPVAEDAPRPSADILEELERKNVFIRVLDQDRCWYRYHPLFVDVLRGHLQRSHPDQLAPLHGRASAWFEGQQAVPEAVHHALAAGAWERASRLISANVFALLEQNELNTVAGQIDALTGQRGSASPWLWVGRAWLAAYTGQLGSVESILNMAEAEIDEVETPEERQTLRGHCAAIRAFSAWCAGGEKSAASAAQAALDCLRPTDSMIRCLAATVLGLSSSNMNARSEALEQAMMYAREGGLSNVSLFAQGCRAYMLVLEGRLREAYQACHEAMWQAQSASPRQPLPALSHILSTLSLILCEWNDLDGAVRYGREGVALAKRWQQADAMHFACTVLGDALFASGDTHGAFEVLREAWQIAHRTSTWFEEISIAQEIDWHLTQNDTDIALQRLGLAGIDIDHPPQKTRSALIPQAVSQLLLAQKNYTRALALITADVKNLESDKVVYFQVRALVRQALAYYGLGQTTPALASLKRALALATPEGYIRSLITAGPGLDLLLREARAAGIHPEYVDRLLAVLEPSGQAAAPASELLVEPLSAREMDVLRLLSQGLSDKEIAEKLVIATGTVHKHLNNIYGKLDAHSRTTAIVRAREMGLL